MTYMVDLTLDSAKLMRFAHMQGLPLGPDEDFGYATHAWLAAVFGDIAPRPFRLFERRDGLHLLGYCRQEIGALKEHAQTFAEPVAMKACQWDAAAGKTMPEEWVVGRRLGFEVRVCPVIRGDRERDAFLAAIERSDEEDKPVPSRYEVYIDWLVQRMAAATETGGAYIDTKGEQQDPAIELLSGGVSVIGFRRVRVLRGSKRKGKSLRAGIERPDALLSGDLVIRDSEKFGHLLERGIGRHRAFGFGMLLLRPPAI